jgi:uncharacterized protein (DUF1778 family)
MLYAVCMTESKTIRLDMRVSPEEKELYQRAAEKDGRSLSNWIRDRLNRAAKEELADTRSKSGMKPRAR